MEKPVNPTQALPARELSGPDASIKNLSAIHGNFIPLQSPGGLFLVPPRRSKSPRQRSQSPRRRQDRGVHLHLSLTDSQMDKLTSTLTRDEVETKQGLGVQLKQRDETLHSIFRKKETLASPSASQGSASDLGGKDVSRSHHYGSGQQFLESASAESFIPAASGSRRSRSPEGNTSPPGRSYRQTQMTYNSNGCPACQDTGHRGVAYENVDIHLASNTGAIRQESPQPVTGGGQQGRGGDRLTYTSSSVYSIDDRDRVLGNPECTSTLLEDSVNGHQSAVLQDYARWSLASPKSTPSLSGEQNGCARQGSEINNSSLSSHPKEIRSHDPTKRVEYSPLTSFTPVPKLGVPQKGRKVMVGTNGWLERTGNSDNKHSPPKKVGIFDALKRMAKEVAEATDIKVARKAKDCQHGHHLSRLRTSLNPREQSLLYCELEFLLTSVLDGYITSQFNAGRLNADKYKKIVDMWNHKGRPKVVGFRYDLETQLDLVHLHVDEFRFYGDRAGISAAIGGILGMLKVDARAIRIRTFCQPDPVIAKQLLDSQSLLNLLGCSESRQIQLAEVLQFFKVVLERENHAQADMLGR